MKTSLECLPCLLRQAADAVERSTGDAESRIRTMRKILLVASSLDYEASPPELSAALQGFIRAVTDCTDPYREDKRRFNQLALKLLPALETQALAADDPFTAAVNLAIAGNVIDLGAKSGLTHAEVEHAVANVYEQPLHGDVEALRQAADRAERILYLTDNAGEIVFDTVLIRQLPPGRVTVVVRGAPTLNDATEEDAVAVGIPGIASLITNGSDIPGTVPERCSPAFQEAFATADLIIAKGQGNYETLNTSERPVIFLFRVKCPIVAADSGLPIGSHVVWLRPER